MKIYRARHVLPMVSPPIEDGVVCVDRGRITAVGRRVDFAHREIEDLGDVILLPGLINAHCHLDYTGMRNAILFSHSFAQWVRRLNELKRTQTDENYLDAIAAGFQELRRWGTTSVYNIESFPELMVKMAPPPLRTWWFYELLDIRTRIHTEEVVAGALAFFDTHQKWLGGFGLSPHAPYSTSLTLYELTRVCCEKYGMPLMTHLAETREEYDMFTASTGVLYDFLGPIGRDMSDTGLGTPVRHLLANQALPKGALLTHMNVLAESDWELLAGRREDFTIVHCPNCHIYFQREPFALERFRQLGMNLCLGTDSLASNKALNLFEEMRTVRRTDPQVPLEELLRMVTVNAAAALGQPGHRGAIATGADADLIALPYEGGAAEIYEAVIENRQPVEWLLVAGRKLPLA